MEENEPTLNNQSLKLDSAFFWDTLYAICCFLLPLMIKAVLLSKLAMTQDSIRNTHTQMLWEKGFRGETLPVLVTKYGQNVIPKTHVTLH